MMPTATIINGLERFLVKLKLSRDPLHTSIELQNLYGDLVTLDNQNFYVGSPKLAEAIMLDYETFGKDPSNGYGDTATLFWGDAMQVSNDVDWLHKRKIIQTALTSDRVNAYSETMINKTLEMMDKWQDGQALNLHQQLGRLTLELTIRNIMGVILPQVQIDQIENALEATLALFDDLREVPTDQEDIRQKKFRAALQIMNDLIYSIIEERRASGQDNGDLLYILMQENMPDNDLRHEMTTFLRAGQRNTATLLTWCFARLTQNPEVERELIAELDGVIGNRLPTFADLPNLKVAEGIVYEGMRLYPLYPFIVRTVRKPVSLNDYALPEGAKLGINVWMLHHDKRYFDDPQRFKPERWQREDQPSKYTFLPFGGGARRCPFKSYGMMEAVLLLSTIAQHYSIRLAQGEKVQISYTKNGLLPKNGLQVILKKR